MKYIISDHLTIELLPEGGIKPQDLDKTLMAITGHVPQDIEGVTVWANAEHRFWLMNDQPLPAEEDARNAALQEIITKTNARPLVPSLDRAFAQSLMRQVPMAICPEPFDNGSLVGTWRVEHISRYNPYDTETHGFLTGTLQPMDTRAETLPLAIAVLFLASMGLGQRAYVQIPASESEEPQLHFVTAHNEKRLLNEAPPAMFFRAENLDKFAIVGVSEDLAKEAYEKAGLRRTILLADMKANGNVPAPQPADEPQAPALVDSQPVSTAPVESETEVPEAVKEEKQKDEAVTV